MLLIVKALLTFDQEIVERNEINKRDGSFDSVTIKDAVRTASINDIVFVVTQIVQNYSQVSEELVNDALFATSQLIDWNALELFSQLVPLFKEFLKPNFKQFRVNAMQCLHAFVHKGMDYPLKI